jgi:hypothetical protein
MIELKDKERVRFVYTNNGGAEYHCPHCGGNVWEASTRTGTGKLNKDQVKLKCVLCLNWFIGNKNKMERVLGEV